MASAPNAIDREKVKCLLGREPRGLEAIQVRNASGEPSVIRVAALVDDKPFPTLFWLVDPALNRWLARLEAAGKIAELQQLADSSSELQEQLCTDHRAYIAARERYMTPDIKAQLVSLGYFAPLQARGIGGIANFNRVRCLHTFYAAHLVQANSIGLLLEQRYREADG
ncbi:MAG: DUF501 domain-containing protein [Gammaproteobacteria bacterium]|nr:DUF501 domain-containing protein [Gammaproteobacteria bacterium]